MANGLRDEVSQIEAVLRGYETDIAKLQGKLREARARQNSIAARLESAVTRAKASEIMHGSRTEEAFAKFELLERRADFAEGRADALGLAGPRSLEEEIAELKAAEAVDAELEAMKAALEGARIKEGTRGHGQEDLSLFARSPGREGRRGLLDAGRRFSIDPTFIRIGWSRSPLLTRSTAPPR